MAKPAKKPRKPPVGSTWRILAHGRKRSYQRYSRKHSVDPQAPGEDEVPFATVFDELVISGVLHLEQMDTRTWWMGVRTGEDGVDDLHLWITVGRDGRVRVSVNQGEFKDNR